MAVFDDILASSEEIHAVSEDMLNVLEELLTVVRSAKGSGGGSGGSAAAEAITIGELVSEIALAVAAIAALPGILAAAVSPFVDALNPGLMLQFNVTLRNLLATIGNAFTPVISAAINALQQMAQLILPLTYAIKPLVAAFSDAAFDLSVAVVGVLVELANTSRLYILPLKDALIAFIKAIAAGIVVFSALLEAFNHQFLLFIALSDEVDNVRSDMNALRGAIVSAASGMAQLHVMILRLLGLSGLVERFRDALRRRIATRESPRGGLVAAPRDAGVGSIEEVVKQITSSAFTAVAGDTFAKSDSDILKQIADAIDTAADFDLGKTIENAVYNGFTRAKDSLVPSIPTTIAGRNVESGLPSLDAGISFSGLFEGVWGTTSKN